MAKPTGRSNVPSRFFGLSLSMGLFLSEKGSFDEACNGRRHGDGHGNRSRGRVEGGEARSGRGGSEGSVDVVLGGEGLVNSSGCSNQRPSSLERGGEFGWSEKLRTSDRTSPNIY